MHTSVVCAVQAELGQMTATIYYNVISVALDSGLTILPLRSNKEFNMSHTNQQVHGQDLT